MNQGRPILTDPKKERMALSLFSGTLESGQMIATGSIMLAGNSSLSAFESSGFFFTRGQEFYSTCIDDNQKNTLLSRLNPTIPIPPPNLPAKPGGRFRGIPEPGRASDARRR